MDTRVDGESTLRRYRQRWTAAFPEKHFQGILRAYREPHRHYHTIEHLADLFECLPGILADQPIPEFLAYAVWYHDVVYDPTRSDNEEQSAHRAAIELAEASVASKVIGIVRRLILLTKHGSAEPASDEEASLLDVDLAILAADARRYERYAKAIRQEYAHVAERDYRNGRSAVLLHFLKRPRIYRTEIAYQNWESAARQNLEGELIALSV
jgi:predicted metal-dependent HD superfamily phosphohydrolase